MPPKPKTDKTMSAKGSITTADYLPYNDYKRLLANLEKDKKYRWCVYCTISFCLGLRISDILKLKWEDIINKNFIVITEKKTGKTKRIDISESAANRLKSFYSKLGHSALTGYIMANETGIKPMSSQYVNRILKTWIKKYSLPINNFSSHTFRKTFGRYVYESNGKTEESLILLNRIFRHSSIRNTIIYIGLTDEEICRVFKAIEI